MQQIKKKERSLTLTPGALARLLHWLDEGKSSNGEQYLEMRRRLVGYFERKNCPAPDDFADETLNRVARRLEEEGITVTAVPAKYCYIVGRMVFLESLRSHGRNQAMRVARRPQTHDQRFCALYWPNFIQSGEWADLDGQR